MDKRYKRNEASDKKIDNKVKDRGDNLKRADKMLKKNAYENTQVNIKPAFPERGDSERKISTNQKPEKMRINIMVKKPMEDSKFKTYFDNIVDKEHNIKKHDKDGPDRPHDIELRKRIRDKYTLKLKSIHKSVHSNLDKKDEGSKIIEKTDINKNADRPKKQLAEETTQTKEKLISFNSSTSSGKTEAQQKKPERNVTEKQERNVTRRKPMIKTIMSKNGSVRIYKAVTFVDQRRPRTPLEINIPGDSMKAQKVSKFTDTSSLKFRTRATVSRASIKEKPVTVRKKTERKRDRKSRHVPSPEYSVRENLSPPTEVARWAPSSIDQYTKPYYEAWVNTTLAAISKSSKKDKLLYEKQRKSLLESFQRALKERPRTPELFYENFHDERYTGRIKIRQR